MSFFSTVFLVLILSIGAYPVAITPLKENIEDSLLAVTAEAKNASSRKNAQKMIQDKLRALKPFRETASSSAKNFFDYTERMVTIFVDNELSILGRQIKITDVLEESLTLMDADEISVDITAVALNLIELIPIDKAQLSKNSQEKKNETDENHDTSNFSN